MSCAPAPTSSNGRSANDRSSSGRRTEATQAEPRALRRSSGSVRSSSGPWCASTGRKVRRRTRSPERALAEAHPGAIICLHDGDGKDAAVTREATVAALPAIVQGLRERRLRAGDRLGSARMIELFPTGSRIESGVLHLDGLAATELAERFGTPLVVYSEGALRERARMFRARRARCARRLRDEGVPERRRDEAARRGRPRRRRGVARRARVRAAGGDRGRPAASSTGTTSRTRSCVPRPRPARSSRSTRSTSRRAQPRRASAGCSSASRPASRPRPTRRSGPGIAARSSASMPTRRSVAIAARARPGWRSRACTCTSAPSSRTAAPTSRPSRSSASSPRAAATSSTGRRRSSTSAAASGSATSRKSRSRRWRSSSARSRTRSRASGPQAGFPAPRLVFEPGPLARRPGCVHALPRRRGQAGG